MGKLAWGGAGAGVVSGAVLVACVGSVASTTPDAGTFDSGAFDAGHTSTDAGGADASSGDVAVPDSAGPVDGASPPPPEAGPTITVDFASGVDWPSFNGDLNGPIGASLGNARAVCVSPGVPANCAANAVVYRSSGAGWTATVDAPNATWVWRGDVIATGLADLQFAIFQKTFTLGVNPAGTIQIAADDFVAVRVNGTLVGSTGSLTDPSIAYQGQSTALRLDLGAYLKVGANTIAVIAQNGPQSFAGCGSPCTFQQNTGGVLFSGSLSSH